MALKLKRRIEKSYSLDEMMFMVNRRFIEQDKNRPSNYDPIRKFSIEPTCYDNEADRWVVCDSRSTSSENGIAHDPPLLPTYYGSTILEAATKCFLDRANHYGKPEEDQIPIPPPDPSVNQKIMKKISLDSSQIRKRSING